MCNNCKNNICNAGDDCNNGIAMELMSARFNREVRRLWIALCISISLLVVSNCAWAFFEFSNANHADPAASVVEAK